VRAVRAVRAVCTADAVEVGLVEETQDVGHHGVLHDVAHLPQLAEPRVCLLLLCARCVVREMMKKMMMNPAKKKSKRKSAPRPRAGW
jgi:hypothetical protein